MKGRNRFNIVAGLALLTLVYTSGCSVPNVKPEFILPSQDIHSAVQPGLSRIVFFNASNKLLYGLDGSGKINIKINKKDLASLKINDYVQIFLARDDYELYLVHKDVMDFKSNYKLKIDKEEVFVKVYSQPFSTDYKIVDQLPADFKREYRSAY